MFCRSLVNIVCPKRFLRYTENVLRTHSFTLMNGAVLYIAILMLYFNTEKFKETSTHTCVNYELNLVYIKLSGMNYVLYASRSLKYIIDIL